MNMPPVVLRALMCASAMMVVSCATMPPLRRPVPHHRELAEATVPEAFAATTPTVAAKERWWQEFGSDELNRLMDEAFAGNLDVSRAWARLRQAQAQASRATAAGKLQIVGSADASTKRVRQETNGSSDRDSSNSFSLGLVASYEVDLWGRIRAGVQSAELAAQASERDAQATALVLSGNLAKAWLQYRSAMARIAVVEGQIETGRKYLELLRVRQRKSLSDTVDVLQQQQQVASLESALPPLRESLASLGLQLRYLLGRPPQAPLELGRGGLPEMPADLALGVPARMLAERPDIRAAWLRLRAQEWSVTEAEADRLPALSLTGTGSFSSPRFESLFSNWVLNLASSLTGPLMDGGRRRAVVRQENALADERFLDYRDTVLGALHEVADALSRETWKREYLTRLDAELRLARQTLDETQRRYRNGLSDYLPVLTALSSLEKVELGMVSARADLLSNRIDLYKAVGGQLVSAAPATTNEPAPPSGDRE
jgi:NodT family efflux transporter outer membrane factor (OMF) lipoprotein